MRSRKNIHLFFPISFAAAVMLAGCSYSLVHDNPIPASNVVAHCEGSENIDDSSIAVFPIPAAAFVSPHTELHPIEPEDYLNRCGPPTQLVNRDVTVDKTNCVPAAVTEILTLGIWQWCPAVISYEADVIKPPAGQPAASVSSVTQSSVQTTDSRSIR